MREQCPAGVAEVDVVISTDGCSFRQRMYVHACVIRCRAGQGRAGPGQKNVLEDFEVTL